MIEFLFFAAMLGQVGMVKSHAGDRIDFGPGSLCMFTLPRGYVVRAGSSDSYLIRFDNHETDHKKAVYGSARVLDQDAIDERQKHPKPALRTYKNATIESATESNGSPGVFGFEVVIGHQVIRFSSLSEASLPKAEDIVDACGPAG